MEKRITILLTVAILAIIGLSTGLFAYNNGVLAGDPKISETEAKNIAEQHVGGEAKSVELEREGTTNVYEVLVVTKDGTFEVEIDADSGKVLEVEPDDGTEDEDEDESDDDDQDDDDDDEQDDNDADENEQDDDEKTEGNKTS